MLIELQACAPAANCYRRWRVEVGPDLFGLWTARVTFGRIGRAGRTIRYEFSSEPELQAFLRNRLRRRASAERRIGVAYSVTRAPSAAEPLLRLAGF
jgi:hypothetical protein